MHAHKLITVIKRSPWVAGSSLLVLFVVTLAGLGLSKWGGATSIFAALEVENGSPAAGATVQTDAAASGGRAVQFGSPTPAGSVPWLKTSGRFIVAADSGRPVMLRGANIMRADWEAGYDTSWEEKAIPELAKWGGSVVVRGFASDPVNGNNAKYLQMLDTYVSLVTANDMYVVFMWRSDIPDGPQPNAPDASAKSALPKLAARYKNDPHVMYGLQVEPHGAGSDWTTLRPVFESMIDDIRGVSAPNTPIVFVPGSEYSQDVSGAVDDPVNRANVVYKPHAYQPSSNYQRQFGAAYDAGLPVFVGEFGPTESATMSDINTLMSFTSARGIGWAAWWMDYANQGTEALVKSATDLSPTEPYGARIRQELLTTPALP